MNIFLFGYPKTGKTSLFNLLTEARIEIKTYDDGKKEPTVRNRPIPDSRLDAISTLYPEKKKIAASLDFTDSAGMSFGEVKDSLFLSHLRKADGLIHVVRGFRDIGVPRPKGDVNPVEDIRLMEEELVLADLLMVGSRLGKLERDLLKIKDAEGEKEKEVLKKLQPLLENGKGLRDLALAPAEEKLLRSFSLLSLKPLLHMINLDEADAARMEEAGQIYDLGPAAESAMGFCGKIENEILALEDEERALFMSEFGIEKLSANRFFRRIFPFLDTLSFFTIGKDEVRAWTVKRNTTALRAAGAVHSDMERGFIRAEVIASEDLLKHGSLQKAKEAGAIRLEGKEYVVRDGDVVTFRFSQ